VKKNNHTPRREDAEARKTEVFLFALRSFASWRLCVRCFAFESIFSHLLLAVPATGWKARATLCARRKTDSFFQKNRR
jgi:hypothetical protein